MYSQDIDQIKGGLTNYVMAAYHSLGETREAKQRVVAILLEESLKMAQDEDGELDIYVLKPLMRAAAFTFEQRAAVFTTLNQEKAAADYKLLAQRLRKLTELV